MTEPTITDAMVRVAADAIEDQCLTHLGRDLGTTHRDAIVRAGLEAAASAAPAWQPPPPGSTREQLPDHLLALIDVPRYTSTACETARECERVVDVHTEHAEELRAAADHLHDRCRINHKFTGVPCGCHCHQTMGQS
ncbi:hypothetical protein [Streptomyces sp. AA1529]|uniref:hypothetical protein n=1 Tax=Streptomyces sp. AA1529 TaxID=1203257 RepID=UPI0002D9B57E|nr:hypothetical protein [Streptomyces sp. AA1529]